MYKLRRFIFLIFTAFALLMAGCENDADGDFEVPKTNNLASPANFKAVYNPVTNETTFTWDAVADAVGYSILASTKNDSVTAVKILSPNGTTGTVYGYSSFVGTYYYWLFAYNNTDESKLTEVQSVTTIVQAPSNLECRSVSNGVISLSWAEMEGVSGYKVYHSPSEDGTYTAFSNTITTAGATITLSSYSPKSYYKVTALKGGTESSDFSNTVAVDIPIFAPKNVQAEKTSTYGEVSLSWNKISGVTGYKIYRDTDKNGDYAELVATLNDDSREDYTVKDLAKGNYYFFIKSYYETEENLSPLSVCANARILIWYPQNITVSERTEESLTLTWDAVDDATSYKITIIGDEGTEVSNPPTPTANTVTITGLSAGTVYSVQIQGVESDGEPGEISPVVMGKTNISAPTLDSSNTIFGLDSILVAWNEAKGATSYKLKYSKTNDADSATEINDEIAGTSCLIENLETNVTYYYWVCAVDSVNNYTTGWTGGSGITMVTPTDITISKSDNYYYLTWNYSGESTNFRVRCYKCSSIPSDGQVPADDAVVISSTVIAKSYNITSLLNNRDDGYFYYMFTVDAYCAFDGQWYQGSTSDGYGWYFYDQTWPYGESTQLPSSKTLITPRSYYSTYSSAWTTRYISTTSSQYLYFKATAGKTYKIYYADKYSNSSVSYTSYTKTDIKSRYYCAGASSSADSFAEYDWQSFTPLYDSYWVIEIQKYSSSTTSGYYGIQIVETD